MIQAVPTLQLRGSCIAQKINSKASQSGRNGCAASGSGMIDSIRPTKSVMTTGKRRSARLIR